ncbi:MAG: hypothetical protein PVSMB8_04570 [Vulcanimicrobiaceae bacterium]
MAAALDAGQWGRFAQLTAAHVEAEAVRGVPSADLVAKALHVLESSAFNGASLLTFARHGRESDLDRIEGLLGETPPAGLGRAYRLATEAVLLRRRGHLAAANTKAAIAADVAERHRAPLLRACALELLGRLPEAIAVYETCGAASHVRRLREEKGVRLTAREREIADLAAAGMSNRAIAERLVLSERTVEHHVAAVYTKLGYRSRGDLIARFTEGKGSAKV